MIGSGGFPYTRVKLVEIPVLTAISTLLLLIIIQFLETRIIYIYISKKVQVFNKKLLECYLSFGKFYLCRQLIRDYKIFFTLPPDGPPVSLIGRSRMKLRWKDLSDVFRIKSDKIHRRLGYRLSSEAFLIIFSCYSHIYIFASEKFY